MFSGGFPCICFSKQDQRKHNVVLWEFICTSSFPISFPVKLAKRMSSLKGVVEDVMVSTGTAKYYADFFFECKLSREVNENNQFSSVTQLCLTLCNPMNRSTPGLPVHHHLPEFTQTHVHRISDAIQPSHPRSSPSPPAPSPSQHQSLFQ